MHMRVVLIVLAFVAFVQPSLLGQSPRPVPAPAWNLKHLDGKRLVFVVNGAGEATTVSDHLTALGNETNQEIHVQMVTWCRGANALEDYKDTLVHLLAARRLAGWTLLIRRDCPNAEISYVGHSTGTRIALLAAEMLPEKTLERIILIASVDGSRYDLRPALRSSRSGIDHFWSAEDEILERVPERWGLPDGSKGQAAGYVGFHYPHWTDAEGFDAYRNIRQYRWHAGLHGSGGHFTWSSRTNIQNAILPLLCTTRRSPDFAAGVRK